MKIRAGILSVQGDYAAHAHALAESGAETINIIDPRDLKNVDCLVFPGGESTTMSMLLTSTGLREPLINAITNGMPTLATCAGVILLAKKLSGDTGSIRVKPLSLLDCQVDRNTYGRQAQSFEVDIEINWSSLGAPGERPAFPAVFIRAPGISKCSSEIEVLAWVNSQPVLIRQGAIIAATFHPELSGDFRLHKCLLNIAEFEGK